MDRKQSFDAVTEYLFEAYDGSREWMTLDGLVEQDAEPCNVFGVRMRSRDGGWIYHLRVDDSCPAYSAKRPGGK